MPTSNFPVAGIYSALFYKVHVREQCIPSFFDAVSQRNPALCPRFYTVAAVSS